MNSPEESEAPQTIVVTGTPVKIDEKQQLVRRLPSGKMTSKSRDAMRRRLWAENSIENFQADYAAWKRSFPRDGSTTLAVLAESGLKRLIAIKTGRPNSKERIIAYFHDVGQMVSRDALREAAYSLVESGMRLETVRAGMLDFLVEIAYKSGR